MKRAILRLAVIALGVLWMNVEWNLSSPEPRHAPWPVVHTVVSEDM